MPIIRLVFHKPLNVSVQLGDVAYYCDTVDVGPTQKYGPHATAGQDEIIKIGDIVDILQWDGTQSYIECDMNQSLFNQYGPPNVGSFIMFSKDNKVNLSSILGYYAEIEFKNNSQDEAELFSVGADFFESSK